MVNLPRRKEQLEVEIPGTDATLYVRPMSDGQTIQVLRILEDKLESFRGGDDLEIHAKKGGWYEIRRNGDALETVQGREKAEATKERLENVVEFDLDELRSLEALTPILPVVEENVVGAEGVEIEGEPFDASDEGHKRSIPWDWKAMAVGRLVSYAMMPEEVGKG